MSPAPPPRWRPLRSVRSRILAAMLVVTAAGMLVAGATAYLVQRERVLASVDVRLADAVEEVDAIVAESPGATLEQALSAVIQQLRPGSDEATFALTSTGTALVPAGAGALRPERDPAFVDRVTAEAAASAVRGTATTTEGQVRYVAIPVAAPDGSRGIVVVAVDLGATLAGLTDAFRTFAIVAGASLLVVGLVGWSVAGRLLAPIRRLRRTAARITASDVTERIEVTGNDDVSDLTGTVNGMLDRLDAALTGQRQLLDDVGHELKTPITIVRGHLELLDPADPADVRATRELAIDELDRMNGLVRDIAVLSQAQRPLTLTRAETDLGALVERVRTKAVALSPTNTWSTAVQGAPVAVVDAERLTQALLQLAANAVTHARATRIELGASTRGGTARLWVRDDGVGIPPELRESIFERFRRGSTGRGSTGSGLGLAIVAAIARAHGGSAWVEDSGPPGAMIVVEVPMLEEGRG